MYVSKKVKTARYGHKGPLSEPTMLSTEGFIVLGIILGGSVALLVFLVLASWVSVYMERETEARRWVWWAANEYQCRQVEHWVTGDLCVVCLRPVHSDYKATVSRQ